jgi:hypothetical protein
MPPALLFCSQRACCCCCLCFCLQSVARLKQFHAAVQGRFKAVSTIQGRSNADIKMHAAYGQAYNNMKQALKKKGIR